MDTNKDQAPAGDAAKDEASDDTEAQGWHVNQAVPTEDDTEAQSRSFHGVVPTEDDDTEGHSRSFHP